MADTVNEKLFDFQVAQAIRWIRLGNREAKEAIKILNRVNDDLKRVIRDSGVGEITFSQRRRVALQRQIDDLLDAIHEQVASEIVKTSEESAVLAAEMEVAALQRAIPEQVAIKLDIVTPNIGVLQQAATIKPFNGAVLGDWVDQLREADKARVWRTTLDGIVSGDTTENIIRQVIGSPSLNYKDGTREVTRRGVTALVRTSINHATNQGRNQVWEENDDIISHVKWVSTLDTRTTPICRHRDGRVGPVKPDPNYRPPPGQKALKPQMARPPAHPNCRSQTVAITKSWKDLGFDFEELEPGTRSSLDGRVPEDKTYFEWLSSTSKANQIEALGPARYKLWKEGGLKIDKFQNNEGELLTLDELRKRKPEAFEKSGL